MKTLNTGHSIFKGFSSKEACSRFLRKRQLFGGVRYLEVPLEQVSLYFLVISLFVLPINLMLYFCTCDMPRLPRHYIIIYYNICTRSLYRNVINYFCFTGESIGSLLGGYLLSIHMVECGRFDFSPICLF